MAPLIDHLPLLQNFPLARRFSPRASSKWHRHPCAMFRRNANFPNDARNRCQRSHPIVRTTLNRRISNLPVTSDTLSTSLSLSQRTRLIREGGNITRNSLTWHAPAYKASSHRNSHPSSTVSALARPLRRRTSRSNLGQSFFH